MSSERSVGKEIGNQLAHVGLGFAFAGLFGPSTWWGCVLLAFFVGYVREDAQHRKSDGWGFIFKGDPNPFVGRTLDLQAFAFGGLGGWAIRELVIWLGPS